MQRVLPAARAELVELHPAGVVPLVLAGAVRALLAGGARQRDHWAILGLGHGAMSSSVARRRPRQTRAGHRGKRADSRPPALGLSTTTVYRARAVARLDCPPEGRRAMTTPSQPAEDLARIVEAAQRLGVELDEAEALRWLAAMAADRGRRDRGRRRQRHVRPSGQHARLLAGAPGPLPARSAGSSSFEDRPRRGDRAGALRLGGPVEDPDLTRATATSSSGSTSTRRPARRRAASLAS